MIRIDNLTKEFHRKHGNITAFKNISLQIEDGEFLSITGPSGSGKSTLLLTLGGMSAPTDGKVFWNDLSIYDLKLSQRAEWRAKSVGFVFQTFNLIPYLNVYENVSIALNLSLNKNKEHSDILNVLEEMQLSNRLDHLPRELSIGQQQRVALARALIKDPDIILADEPTGNLDPATASEIMEVLQNFHKKGKTVILITHDPNIARLANRNIDFNLYKENAVKNADYAPNLN
ncbi:MAG: ABC transporter ATP-binding protein [Desulfobacterales bacterium]|nr:ABC transporter ATP-binding protein [Desulfobacterales bacterium]